MKQAILTHNFCSHIKKSTINILSYKKDIFNWDNLIVEVVLNESRIAESRWGFDKKVYKSIKIL